MSVSLTPSILSRLPVVQPAVLTLEALRVMVKLPKANLMFELRRYGNGYALWFDLKRHYGQMVAGWLISEKSKKVRVFAKAETAFIVARGLGLSELCINLSLCHSEIVSSDG